MVLFDGPDSGRMVALPLQCEAFYCADFLSEQVAAALWAEIVEGFDVSNRRVRMADGTEYFNETGAYLFCDPELTGFDCFHEVWGGRSPWSPSLSRLRDKLTELLGVRFRVARSVFYHDGSEGIGFHSDLPAYGDTSLIASLSLGAERRIVFRHKASLSTFSLSLSPGSLLIMGEGCQELYEHAIPHDTSCCSPRLNLTFRRYGFDGRSEPAPSSATEPMASGSG